MKRRTLWRLRSRGLAGSVRHTWYYLYRFARISTPRKLANVILAKTSKRLRLDRLVSMPYRYTIDPSNVCNLRCPLCPTGLGILKRDRGLIKLEEFERLVDQISPWCYLLELYNWGEPFLHPEIFKMIRYAHEHRMLVRLSSNLNRYNEEMARQTVEAGLDSIIVSVDGATEASYQRYRRRGKLETVLGNLRSLVEARRTAGAHNPLIVVRMLISSHNEHEVDKLRETVLALGADVFVAGDLFIDTTDPAQRAEWLPSDAASSAYQYEADHLDQANIENVWHCSDLWESMTINWNGGVSPCCWVHNHAYDFANVLEKPLRTIWNDDAYVSARRVFARGGPREGPSQVICTQCRGRPRYLKI